jgi:hypothetical protein
MIEETPLLKRLAFKQSDTHWLTWWDDARNPIKSETIVELVRREDRIVLVNEVYNYSDLAIKHYSQIAKNMNAEHMDAYSEE